MVLRVIRVIQFYLDLNKSLKLDYILYLKSLLLYERVII